MHINNIRIILVILIAVFLLLGYAATRYNKEDVGAPGVPIVEENPVIVVPAGPDDTATMVTLSLGEMKQVNGVTLTLGNRVNDSRCAIGVQCVWEGSVSVETTIESGSGKSTQMITLGTGITTEAEVVSLTSVTPYPKGGEEIVPTDYRFTFEVVRR